MALQAALPLEAPWTAIREQDRSVLNLCAAFGPCLVGGEIWAARCYGLAEWTNGQIGLCRPHYAAWFGQDQQAA